jgi:uroporphyrinogen-III decarboxylase
MKKRELMLRTLFGDNLEEVPIAPLVDVSFSSKNSFVDPIEYVLDYEVKIRSQLYCQEKFGYDWIFLLGMGYMKELRDNLEKHEGYIVINHPLGFKAIITSTGQQSEIPFVKTIEDINKLKIPNLKEQSKENSKSLSRIIKQKDIFVCAGVPGPSFAARLIGYEKFLADFIERPSLVKELLALGKNYSVEFGIAQIDSGVDGLLLYDSRASPDLIGPRLYKDYIFPLEKEVVRELKRYKDIPIIFHLCAKNPYVVKNVLGTVSQMGIDCLSVESIVNLQEVKQKGLCALGNIDPIFLENAKKEDVYKKSISLIHDTGKKSFVLSSGCVLTSNVPPENLLAMVNAARSYNRNLLEC